MTEWVIPLPNETEPSVTQSVSLSGRTYVFGIDWNSRTDRWTIRLVTEDGVRILDGALLCMGVDILRTIPSTLDYVPPGELWLGGDDDPTLVTTQGVTLFYITEDE
jgi:hypothetical protein